MSEEWADDQMWIRPLSKFEFRADGTVRAWNRSDDTWTEWPSYEAYRMHLEAKTRDLLGDGFMDQLDKGG